VAAVPRVGRVFLAGLDGRIAETCLYDVPVVLREPTLHVNGGSYQQARQEPNGTWVYRYLGQSAHPSNPDLKDFRNDQHPDYDGPAIPPPIATMQDVKHHFDVVLNDAGVVQLHELYRHFLAALSQQPFTLLPEGHKE
jgi:hypothetical protein